MKKDKTIAKYLLQIKAIKLEPANPFTWSSGWLSPIYCDNRKSLSFPYVRDYIRDQFVDLIKNQYPETEIIAGVATGAIAHGILVAEKLNLPFVYVRPNPKGHGLGNQIEGYLEPGKKTVVIEDLISTGNSSLKAVEALRQAEAKVAGMLAIFSYGFQKASDNFRDHHCNITTLSDYNTLIDEALNEDYIKASDLDTLKEWRKDPENWKPSK